MGLLVEGRWLDQWYDTEKSDGAFKRETAQLRHWVTPDGSAGPTGESGFKAESGRYHLYVSLACPWAHRTLIFRHLKGLEDHIDVSVVHPHMLENGWQFSDPESCTTDTLFGKDFLYQVYLKNDPEYTGRVTVPVLWDKQQQRIVSNESAEIIRMMNSAFNEVTGNMDDYYPADLRTDIDAMNAQVYQHVNNGVYRCGFATSQDVYREAYGDLFETLEKLEQHLGEHRYLVGDQLTEADWRLFTTLIRFDAVYHGHFKCNKQRLEDFPHLSAYTRDLYQRPGVAETVNFYHIKQHYYVSHPMINPTQIVPEGPEIDYWRPHGRA